MSVLAGLISILALSLFFSRLFRRSSALMPLLAVSAAMLFFTAAGCLGLLWPAGFVWYGLCGAALVFALIKTRGRLSALISPGLILFFLGSVFFILLFYYTRPMLSQWDEFTFWGPAAKITSRSGQLYTTARSSLIARSYPPGLIVYGYMMQFFGVFTEHGLIASFAVLYLACSSAACAVWDKNRSACTVFFAAFAAIPLIFEAIPYGQASFAYLTVMADLPMAAMFGAALCFYFAGGEKSARLMIPFAVILAALTNVKDMGLALALCALLTVGLDMAFCQAPRLSFTRLRGRAAFAVCCLCGVLAIAGAYLLWTLHLSFGTQAVHAVNRFDLGSKSAGTSFNPLDLLISGTKMLFGFGRTAQFSQVLSEMLRALLNRQVFLFGSGAVAFGIIITVTLAAFLLGVSRRQRRGVVVFTAGMSIGFVLFYLFNIFTYALVFSPIEASFLSGYARYIAPFWIAWLMGALVFLARAAVFHAASFHRIRLARAVCAVICVLLLCCAGLRSSIDSNFLRISPALYAERLNVRAVAAAARAEGAHREDIVYIVCQEDNGARFYQLGYELEGVCAAMFSGALRDERGELVKDENGLAVLYGSAASTLADPDAPPRTPYDVPCTSEELTLFLKQQGCTHLLIDTVNEYFLTAFSSMFSDGLAGWEGLERGSTYYRVTFEDGACVLLPNGGDIA